jgi:hypothetical protein
LRWASTNRFATLTDDEEDEPSEQPQHDADADDTDKEDPFAKTDLDDKPQEPPELLQSTRDDDEESLDDEGEPEQHEQTPRQSNVS